MLTRSSSEPEELDGSFDFVEDVNDQAAAPASHHYLQPLPGSFEGAEPRPSIATSSRVSTDEFGALSASKSRLLLSFAPLLEVAWMFNPRAFD